MSLSYRKLSRGVAHTTVVPPDNTAPQPPKPVTAYSRSILDFGAKADGTTNDISAIKQTIDDVAAQGGGVVLIPDQAVMVSMSQGNGGFSLPDNVIIRGAGSASELRFTASSNADWYPFFSFAASGSHLENLRITRGGDVYGVVLLIKSPSDKSWLHNVTINGQKDLYNTELHCAMISGSTGTIRDFTISGSTIRRCDFGLFQPTADTVTVDGFRVYGSLFEYNSASDLEFNAPNSVMQNIVVSDCTFRNSLSSGPGAGWAVGLANVQNAKISGCTVTSYPVNGMHVEDRSSAVTITGNTFSNVSTSPLVSSYASHIIVLGGPGTTGGSHDITITGNLFDTTQQTNVIDCVYVGSGGATGPPYDVVITNNTAVITNESRVVGIYDASNVTTEPNTIVTTLP